jgi:transposase
MDESRFGFQTVQRWRITLHGVEPQGPYHHHRFANFYLYGAVYPTTGEGDFEVARRLSQATFAAYMKTLATAQPDSHHVFLLDNSATHRVRGTAPLANVTLLFQPPYALEFNPIERLWHEAKRHLAWRSFPDLVALQDAVVVITTAFSLAHLISLTAAD